MIEKMKKVCDSAETYYAETIKDEISFENGKLKEINSAISEGFSVRMIKGGRMGFSFTTTLKDRAIENCSRSMKIGNAVSFSFPKTLDVKGINSFDPSIEKVDNKTIVEECERVVESLSKKIKGQINVSAQRMVKTIKVTNTEGTDLLQKSSYYFLHPSLYYPNSTAAIERMLLSKGFENYSEENIEFLSELWNCGNKKIDTSSGKKEVLFLPGEVPSLLLSFAVATNGKTVCEGKSPLAGRMGEEIFEKKINIHNNPLDGRFAGARAFDDEGVLCRRSPLVENGVLKNFYYDLEWASRAKVEPTGNGMKRDVSSKPGPDLENLIITPGSSSFQDMVREMDDGIIVCGTLGCFTGNLYKGDFSMGVAPALVVKKGEIKGRTELMVSGNLYEVMKNVTALENTLHPASYGNFPAILLGEVNVSVS